MLAVRIGTDLAFFSQRSGVHLLLGGRGMAAMVTSNLLKSGCCVTPEGHP